MRTALKTISALLCFCSTTFAAQSIDVPVLAYHKIHPTKTDSMTLSTSKFEAQMAWLKNNGYTVIPMSQLVNYLHGKINTLPPKPVVITDDDGRDSVYTYMLPIIKKYHYPVTLFIYPQIISHQKYALTWEQLKELQKTGLFTVEDHTYWHPNFKQDKKSMSPSAYEKMVFTNLVTSKKLIEKKLGTPVTLLAWPFGIHDAYLENQAAKYGYQEAFTISHRDANRSERSMAQPRYMIVEGQTMKTFESIMTGHAYRKNQVK